MDHTKEYSQYTVRIWRDLKMSTMLLKFHAREDHQIIYFKEIGCFTEGFIE